MIVVRVELWSAVNGGVTELARMFIANDGLGTERRCHYAGRTFVGRDVRTLSRQRVSKTGEVRDWPRHVARGDGLRQGAASMNETPPRNGVGPAVAKPREPTPQDNRRVLDALEAHYDIDRGFYHKSWSDKALASQLDVPANWVSTCRERFFGGPDRNEAAPLAAIDALEKRLTRLVNDAAQIETDLNKLKGSLSV